MPVKGLKGLHLRLVEKIAVTRPDFHQRTFDTARHLTSTMFWKYLYREILAVGVSINGNFELTRKAWRETQDFCLLIIKRGSNTSVETESVRKSRDKTLLFKHTEDNALKINVGRPPTGKKPFKLDLLKV